MDNVDNSRRDKEIENPISLSCDGSAFDLEERECRLGAERTEQRERRWHRRRRSEIIKCLFAAPDANRAPERRIRCALDQIRRDEFRRALRLAFGASQNEAST